MIEIVEVKTKKQQRQFVDFPTKLYKDNEFYVHPLRGDEFNWFNPKKNVSFEECDIVFYLAYQDKKVVGRICGIVQKVYNEKTQSKRVRFSRFDCVEDFEVAKALLNAVEKWAKSKKMEIVHGPLGFNDLDREGLLIEGFDQLATFEENYNFPYYRDFLEKLGYAKEIDYLAFRINLPKESDERVKRISALMMKKYKLKIATAKSKKEYINRYKEQIFDLIDEAYGDLYGVIPYNEKMRKQLIDQFNLIINLKYMVSIVDENDQIVAFGFAIPSIANEIRKSKGRLFPFGVFRILHAKNHCRVADFGLVGVKKEYKDKGVIAIILDYIVNGAKEVGVETVETNHSLEDNYKIIQTWKNFDDVTQHKRFRCFIKNLNEKSKSKTKSTKKSTKAKSDKKTTKSKAASKSTKGKKTIKKTQKNKNS